ncbi:LAME_0F01970g1_1 [Lachancea meyersii CBS 8951]|uniref:LAME_0F01970g1_1 n=1 Tax=Lachancea meyersii CBS 8951 TaxID=1266667 RepID=A0A1G4JQ36_9SACH|nr:LAME_0F01970g1_1 [Lachancea meyersii CBS 8951]
MCARRLNYAGGDNLPLYATPEEAMKAGQRRDEEERRRRARKYEYLPPVQNSRQSSAPPMAIPVQRPMNPSFNGMPVTQSMPQIPPVRYSTTPQHSQQLQQQQLQQQQQQQQHNSSMMRYHSMPQPVTRASRPRPVPAAPAHTPKSPPAIPPARSRTSLDETGGNANGGDSQQDSIDAQIATQLFHNHDVKQRGRLTAEELQNLLQNDDNTHFCISSVDALINLFGASRFGTVNLSEFVSLYKRVKKWRKIYVDNDINGSFTITASEFHNSLQELGYLVPFDVSENLFDQYAEFIDPSKNGKELKFDRFVETLVWLMRLTKMFRKFDNNQEGVATVPYKDFIDLTLYLGRFLPH